MLGWWWLCGSLTENPGPDHEKKTLQSVPSKPRMPIPTSALLRPNVTGKPTKECLSSLVFLLSFGNLVSVWIYSRKSQPGPYSTLCCIKSLHYPSHMIILQSFAPSPWLQQNTEKCGGSKNALVYKPSGRWPAWWPSPPAKMVSVKRESMFFFAETTISHVQANMTNALQKNPLQWTFSNVSGCWLYFLPSAWPVW